MRISKPLLLRTMIVVLGALLLSWPQAALSLTEDERNNIELYQRLAPGVVNITSTVLEQDFFFNVVPRQGAGSGAVIDPRGYILTNHHVIEDARKLEVTLNNGKKYTATLVGSDPDTDLAVVKIEVRREELAVIPMGTSSNLKVGQKVLAIGNPFGLGQTLTTGVISSVGRMLRATSGLPVEDIIQTDASINPGNSGGPLLNLKGEVVGINTAIFAGGQGIGFAIHPGNSGGPLIDSSGKMIGINTAIFSPTGSNVGIGFAIPIDTAKMVLNDLMEKGYYAYPWIGASLMTLTRDLAEDLKLPVESGAMLVEVVQGGPADRAGLRGGRERAQVGNKIVIVGGDTIVRIEGERVTDADSAIRKVRKYRPGDRIQVEVVRWSGDTKTHTVTLTEKPKQRQPRRSR
jgi:S1-C subfamily serine protease